MNEVMAERLRIALDMADAGIALMRQNIRRNRPMASDAEVDRILVRWIKERPGAVHGDGVGRPRSAP